MKKLFPHPTVGEKYVGHQPIRLQIALGLQTALSAAFTPFLLQQVLTTISARDAVLPEPEH